MSAFKLKNTTLLIFLVLIILSCIIYFSYMRKNQQNQANRGNNKQNTQSDMQAQLTPKELCIKGCNELLNEGADLSAGPCILDPIPEMSEWVCDIAHNPREEIDNKRENQCNAWHNNSAKHFVEITPECEFIKSV